MIYKIFILVVIFLTLCFAKPNYNYICNDKIPNLSAGDAVLIEKNFSNYVKKEDRVLLALSADWCHSCCLYENLLHTLKIKSFKDDRVLKNMNIQLARMDLGKNQWFLQEYHLERLPFLIYFRFGHLYKFHQVLDHKRVINFIKRLENPVEILQNEEGVSKFFNSTDYDDDDAIIRTVKILGMFYDAEEMSQEVQELKRYAEDIDGSFPIKFAILTNKTALKQLKAIHSNEWFGDYSLSSIIIDNGQTRVYDLSQTRQESLKQILTMLTIPSLQEYTSLNHPIYEKTRLPMAIGIVDSLNDPVNFKGVLKMLENVALKFIDQIHFTWVDGIFNLNKKELLGIKHNKLPALAINMILDEQNNSYVFPENQLFNEENLAEFIQTYLKFQNITNFIQNKSSNQLELTGVQQIIYGNLKETKIIRDLNFANFSKTSDEIVMFFNSKKDKNMLAISKIINNIARRFKSLFVTTIKVACLDLFFHKVVKTQQTPPYFIMYKQGDPSNISIYSGDVKGYDLMKFIQSAASKQFSLPNIPHIPEEILDSYYRDLAFNEVKDEIYYIEKYESDL